MARLEHGCRALEPGERLAVVPVGCRACRGARIRPRLDLGPPLRDLRRSAPADLRGLHGPGCGGAGDEAHPPRAVRRGQHVPQSRAGREDARDDRPHQRRARDPGTRRRVVRPGARGLRHRLRQRLRRAAGLAGRGGARDPDAARWGRGHELSGRPLCVRSATPGPAADPGAPAADDRRERRAQDPADHRSVSGHLERVRDPRGARPQGRDPAGPLRGSRTRPPGDRADGRLQDHDPVDPGRGGPRSRAHPPHERAHAGKTSPTTTRSGPARPSGSPRR